MAASEPGFSVARSAPISPDISPRSRSAAERSPRARSSMTRSSIEVAKVTPAALSDCRSTGASSQGRAGSRAAGGVFDRISSSEPRRSPPAARSSAAGFSASQRSRSVGKAALTSKTPLSRTATTEGPPSSGRQTRPAKAPAKPSVGKVVRAASCIPPMDSVLIPVVPIDAGPLSL